MSPVFPFFVEALQSKNTESLQICGKVMRLLFKQHVRPLPFAATVTDITEIHRAMEVRGIKPGLYVVNTFWAEELLPTLNKVMGSAPGIFFIRDLFACNVRHSPALWTEAARSASALQAMSPRRISVWHYGSQTSNAVAEKAAAAIGRFLADGDFLHVEGAGRKDSGRFEGQPRRKHQSSRRIPVIALPTLLSQLESERSSGVLTVSWQTEKAQLFLRTGRIVKAIVDGTLGKDSLKGAENIYYVLRWPAGKFDFASVDVPDADEINVPITELLCEAARRMQEPRASA